MENAALIAALFALLASISWGFGDFLAAKAAKTVGATTAAYCTSILETIIYVPTYFLILRPDVQLSGAGVAFAAAGGCFVTLAFMSFAGRWSSARLAPLYRFPRPIRCSLRLPPCWSLTSHSPASSSLPL